VWEIQFLTLANGGSSGITWGFFIGLAEVWPGKQMKKLLEWNA
jgi:hypothetical protein